MSKQWRTYLDRLIQSICGNDRSGRTPPIDMARLVRHMYRQSRKSPIRNGTTIKGSATAECDEALALEVFNHEAERLRAGEIVCDAWRAAIAASGLFNGNADEVEAHKRDIRAVDMRPHVVFDRHCIGGGDFCISSARLIGECRRAALPVLAIGDSDVRGQEIDDLPVGILLLRVGHSPGFGRIGHTRIAQEGIVL